MGLKLDEARRFAEAEFPAMLPFVQATERSILHAYQAQGGNQGRLAALSWFDPIYDGQRHSRPTGDRLPTGEYTPKGAFRMLGETILTQVRDADKQGGDLSPQGRESLLDLCRAVLLVYSPEE